MALAEQGAVLQHDRRACSDVVTTVRPALQGCRHEPLRDVAVLRILEIGARGEDPVLEHRRACRFHRDHVEVGERVRRAGLRVLALEHLRQLVVGHRGGRVDLALEEQAHVERLVDDLHRARALRIEPVLDERGEQLVLVAAAPDADLLTLHLGDVGDAAVLVRQLGHARAGEDLGDVDEVAPLVTRREERRQPVDPELGLAGRDDLLRA